MAAESAPEGETIEMRTMNPAFHGRAARARLTPLLGACLAAACLFTLLAAAPAPASVAWTVTSEHGPTNMVPGGSGQYILQAYNVGTSELSGESCSTGTQSGCYVIEDVLPSGVTYDATHPPGNAWKCTDALAGGIDTVRCWHSSSGSGRVRPPGSVSGKDATFRGQALPVILNVLVDPGASGTLDNTAQVYGGAGGTCSGVNQLPSNPACVVSPLVSDPTAFSATPAEFGLLPSAFLADAFDAAVPNGGSGGNPVRQAGAHPFEMRFDFGLNMSYAVDPESGSYTTPVDHVKDFETKLPAGLIGNPRAVPQCPPIDLNDSGAASKGYCPANTQVGSADLKLQEGAGIVVVPDVPVYNMVPPPGTVAAFAINFQTRPVWIYVSLDPTDHYSVIATARDTTEVLPPRAVQLTLWGVPADPAHDPLRMRQNTFDNGVMDTPFTEAPIKPFLTLPSTCGAAGSIQMRSTSWGAPETFTPWMSGSPMELTGCEDSRFQFSPTIEVTPTALTPNTPTGLNVDLSVPQKDDTVAEASELYAQNGHDAAINTPPLKDAKVVLPEGITVSPSAADGLASCSPSEIKLGSNEQPTCPDASKIGTVSIETPLLSYPLTGDVYLASQDDNPFGTTLAMYVVARGEGVIIKLPGKVEQDPVTGRLTTTFSENPPVPFSHLHLQFNEGPRAPLVTPATCGTKTTAAEFSSWNGSLPAASVTSSFAISADGAGAPCGAPGFDPGFLAGTLGNRAGSDSPLTTRFTRTDGDEALSKVEVSLPPGLLGRISTVALCSEADANAGSCGAGSLIGKVTVAAGPGPNPFYITDGTAFITGPYKGAPFGLSIVVHAKAGPIDLGNVVVRSQIQVDPHTAQLRVVSDPLPTILKGIPLQIRLIDVTVDRPGFTFNPTNCSAMSASATLGSTGGRTSTKTARYQAGDCSGLSFKPSFTVSTSGKTSRRIGASLHVKVSFPHAAPGTRADFKSAKVDLPKQLPSQLTTLQKACRHQVFEVNPAGCPAESRVGFAVVHTPVLPVPLEGPAYFVSYGGEAWPQLTIVLQGDGVTVDLAANTFIKKGVTSSTFAAIPDVPIETFELTLPQGKFPALGANGNLCAHKLLMPTTIVAQNGATIKQNTKIAVSGCPRHGAHVRHGRK
jgi:hypothetical protein